MQRQVFVCIKMVIALVKLVFDSKERDDHATVGGGDFVGYDDNGIAFSMRRIPQKYEEAYQKMVDTCTQDSEEKKYARTT